MTYRRQLGAVGLGLSVVLACGPGETIDLGMETSESSSSSGDGDGDPSTSGDGDGDGGIGEFAELCMTGCEHVLECAPEPFAGLYADLPECIGACIALWADCTADARPYLECTIDLDCDEVVTLMTLGPAATACANTYAAAEAACE